MGSFSVVDESVDVADVDLADGADIMAALGVAGDDQAVCRGNARRPATV
jgi:hypothetical protein